MYGWNAKNLFQQSSGKFQKSGLNRKSAHLKPPLPPNTHTLNIYFKATLQYSVEAFDEEIQISGLTENA